MRRPAGGVATSSPGLATAGVGAALAGETEGDRGGRVAVLAHRAGTGHDPAPVDDEAAVGEREDPCDAFAAYGEQFGGEARLDAYLRKAHRLAGDRADRRVRVLGAHAGLGGEEVGGLQG